MPESRHSKYRAPLLNTWHWSEKNPIAPFLKLDYRNQESAHKSSPTRGWAFVPTGIYFLLPVMHISLQVLAGSGGMICSMVDPCLFGDTGIEPAQLDLWSEKNPIASF